MGGGGGGAHGGGVNPGIDLASAVPYSREVRRSKVARYLEKRLQRVWRKKVEYSARKDFANSRIRVRGRFVSKDDEGLLRECLDMV